MEKEGFNITNINIVAGMPCCDVKLVVNGNVVYQEQQISFEDIRELMAKTKLNCDGVLKQLNAISKK